MSANGDEINRREVAWRLFASEFRDADLSYAESDEERAPNYVVTPTGARVNRLFVVGVLTEVEYVSDDYLRARIVDPTGAFVVYAGQYQPEALTFLESADTPMFVAVTGKARTFQPDDSDIVYTSIRPESISEVEATTRDNWVVTTAEQTLERVATMADAIDLVERGDDLQAVLAARNVPEGLAAGIPLAIDHYGTTEHYLAATRDLALDAARVVAGEREEVRPHRVEPDADGDEPVALGLDDLTLATGDTQPAPTTDADDSDTAASDDASADVDSGSTAETGSADDIESAAESAVAETEDAEPAVTEADEPSAEAATVGSTGATEPESTAPDSEPSETAAPDSTESDATEADSASDDAPDAEPDSVGTDEMYELSEEERQEVEENYDVGFSTADEIEGEAGIEPETPQPDVDESAEPDSAADTDEDLGFEASDTAAESEPEPEPETEESAEETAAEFEADHEEPEPSDEESEGTTTENLEDAVVETMQDLGDGAGADRDELVQTVMDEHGVDQDAVEDAIDDALMSGRCYESGENELTAI